MATRTIKQPLTLANLLEELAEYMKVVKPGDRKSADLLLGTLAYDPTKHDLVARTFEGMGWCTEKNRAALRNAKNDSAVQKLIKRASRPTPIRDIERKKCSN